MQDIFLVCFSVVQTSSFDNVKVKWIPEVLHHNPNTPMLLIGTKSDLRDDPDMLEKLKKENKTVVSTKEVVTEEDKQANKILKQALDLVAETKNLKKFIECSAKKQDNLKTVFDTAIRTARGDHSEPQKGRKCKIL